MVKYEFVDKYFVKAVSAIRKQICSQTLITYSGSERKMFSSYRGCQVMDAQVI